MSVLFKTHSFMFTYLASKLGLGSNGMRQQGNYIYKVRSIEEHALQTCEYLYKCLQIVQIESRAQAKRLIIFIHVLYNGSTSLLCGSHVINLDNNCFKFIPMKTTLFKETYLSLSN